MELMITSLLHGVFFRPLHLRQVAHCPWTLPFRARRSKARLRCGPRLVCRTPGRTATSRYSLLDAIPIFAPSLPHPTVARSRNLQFSSAFRQRPEWKVLHQMEMLRLFDVRQHRPEAIRPSFQTEATRHSRHPPVERFAILSPIDSHPDPFSPHCQAASVL